MLVSDNPWQQRSLPLQTRTTTNLHFRIPPCAISCGGRFSQALVTDCKHGRVGCLKTPGPPRLALPGSHRVPSEGFESAYRVGSTGLRRKNPLAFILGRRSAPTDWWKGRGGAADRFRLQQYQYRCATQSHPTPRGSSRVSSTVAPTRPASVQLHHQTAGLELNGRGLPPQAWWSCFSASSLTSGASSGEVWLALEASESTGWRPNRPPGPPHPAPYHRHAGQREMQVLPVIWAFGPRSAGRVLSPTQC
jgi:hypothetical protein